MFMVVTAFSSTLSTFLWNISRAAGLETVLYFWILMNILRGQYI